MALEGTHIRFALDVKDKYQVSNLSKYLAGTVYPDSRYVSKVERELTHPEDFLQWEVLKLDDFKKGWFIHLLYDDLQLQAIMMNFREVSDLGMGPQGSEFWVRLSSIKNLQDIDDMQKFDIKPYLSLLDYVETPNGEKIEDMQRYNRAIQETYKKPVDIKACIFFWKGLGQTQELSDRIEEKTEEYSRNEEIMSKVMKLYSQILESFQAYDK